MTPEHKKSLLEVLSRMERPEGCDCEVEWEIRPFGGVNAYWEPRGGVCAAHDPELHEQLQRLKVRR